MPRVSGSTPYAAGAAGSRRRPWRLWLLLALLIVPVLEIAAIIAVGKVIGGWPTVALLLFESFLGAWLVRREGARTWKALNTALTTGAMPSRQLADAALVLIGGTLLLTPGFLTDIVGFFFILPVTRPITRRLLEQAVRARLLGGAAAAAGANFPGSRPGHRPASPDTVEGRVVDR